MQFYSTETNINHSNLFLYNSTVPDIDFMLNLNATIYSWSFNGLKHLQSNFNTEMRKLKNIIRKKIQESKKACQKNNPTG